MTYQIQSVNRCYPDDYKGSNSTQWGRDKMAAVSQTTLSNAFSWMKMLEFRLKFIWSLFLRVQLTIFHQWFRLSPGDKPLSEPMMVRLPTHICVVRPQWVLMGIGKNMIWESCLFIAWSSLGLVSNGAFVWAITRRQDRHYFMEHIVMFCV